VYTCAEAAACAPETTTPLAHDTFVGPLQRQSPYTAALWQEVMLDEPRMTRLLLDDTTLDKPYSRKMELVTRHWNGKHHAVVAGTNLLTLLWTDGSACLP
jgi:putative transposase